VRKESEKQMKSAQQMNKYKFPLPLEVDTNELTAPGGGKKIRGCKKESSFCVKETMVRLVPDPKSPSTNNVLKSFAPIKLSASFQSIFLFLKSIFRKGYALQEHAKLELLVSKGINVPRPLDSGGKRLFGPLYESFLLMEEVIGISLKNIVKQLEGLPKNDASYVKAHLIYPLARAIQGMHSKGILHRDLNPSNILFRGFDKKNIEVFFIDILNARSIPNFFIRKGMPVHCIISDLYRLNAGLDRWAKKGIITNKDKLRFWVYYSSGNKLLKAKEREILGRIISRTEENLAKR